MPTRCWHPTGLTNLPLVRHVMADRRSGTYAYSKSGTLCYSALFHAGRIDDLLSVLALDPKPHWHDQQWAAKATQSVRAAATELPRATGSGPSRRWSAPSSRNASS